MSATTRLRYLDPTQSRGVDFGCFVAALPVFAHRSYSRRRRVILASRRRRETFRGHPLGVPTDVFPELVRVAASPAK